MRLKIVQGKDKDWRVVLVADNNRTMNISEGYVSRWNAQRSAKRMFPELAADAETIPAPKDEQ